MFFKNGFLKKGNPAVAVPVSRQGRGITTAVKAMPVGPCNFV